MRVGFSIGPSGVNSEICSSGQLLTENGRAGAGERMRGTGENKEDAGSEVNRSHQREEYAR